MQGARTVARSSCTVQAGDCRLPWMNVKRLKVSVSCRMCLGALEQLQSRCFGSPLCTFCGQPEAHTVVIPPIPAEHGTGPGAVFFRHAITAIYIHVLLLTSTGASPPPHDRWRRCGAPRTVFSPASAFPRTDTPEDPAVLRPSYRHANPPKDFKPHEELDLSPNRPTRLRAELDRVHVESHTIQYASKRVFCDKR